MFTLLFIGGAWASAIGIACATSDENNCSRDDSTNPFSEWELTQPYNP